MEGWAWSFPAGEQVFSDPLDSCESSSALPTQVIELLSFLISQEINFRGEDACFLSSLSLLSFFTPSVMNSEALCFGGSPGLAVAPFRVYSPESDVGEDSGFSRSDRSALSPASKSSLAEFPNPALFFFTSIGSQACFGPAFFVPNSDEELHPLAVIFSLDCSECHQCP
jgi:hypothetical protein